MLRSGSILVFARLYSPLDRDKPATVNIVRAGFSQSVESHYRKPRNPLAFFAVRFPLLVHGNRKPAERYVALAVIVSGTTANIAEICDMVHCTHAGLLLLVEAE